MELFNKSGEVLLPSGVLATIHQHVRNLLDSNIGSFVYDRYKVGIIFRPRKRFHFYKKNNILVLVSYFFFQSRMLCRGMSILKDRINANQDFIEGLGEIWDYFFSTILPALDCILFRVKVLTLMQH